ncbi:MAG: Tol-Pal system beta propeller repeat protein TolB [Methylococcaceae bacterium]|nr:Tol-Pal system beta propeller repeat protein TolB [Methylococcaceae bacterium]
MLLYIRKILMLSFFVFTSPFVQAELNIEITGGTESATPIAVVPFGGGSPVNLANVISEDLKNSGYFRPLPEADMLSKPTTEAGVDYRTWQALGQEYLVVGQAVGNYTVQFELFTVVKGQKMLAYQFPPVTANNLRKVAHIIADKIFEKITGRKGVFDTKIAYVTTAGSNGKKIYRLQVADADGQNPKTIASSSYPLMSPTWSADGSKISYVSFETKRSAIYVQTLATGQRQKIASFPGINGAPAFSPDGSQLAVTLSKDGSPNIYVLDINSQSLRRITQGNAIDTEPVWSPDGGSIVFTSDRGGKPQLYKVSSQGGAAKRITFKGAYNARASFSNDGQKIAMVHGNGGSFKIAVLDVASGAMDVLTEGGSDESPSFASNGTMVLYAARHNGREILKAVSTDGKVQLRLPFDGGEVRDPAWSP